MLTVAKWCLVVVAGVGVWAIGEVVFGIDPTFGEVVLCGVALIAVHLTFTIFEAE